MGASRSEGGEQASTSGRDDSKEGAGGKAGPRPTVMGRLRVAFEAVRKEVPSTGLSQASEFVIRGAILS